MARSHCETERTIGLPWLVSGCIPGLVPMMLGQTLRATGLQQGFDGASRGGQTGNFENVNYSRACLSRSALVMTDTELSDMASAATIGLSSTPNAGYSTPAAIGTQITL
jgi:hypothetical protein